MLIERIKAQRQKLGYTQVELSSLSGISLPTIQNIEAGKANPSYQTLCALALTLGLTIKSGIQNADWSYLIQLGLPLSGESNKSVEFNEADLARQIKLACLELLESKDQKTDANPTRLREEEALIAFLLAIKKHFPSWFKQTSLERPGGSRHSRETTARPHHQVKPTGCCQALGGLVTPIDSHLMKKFLQIAGDRLSGDWVILGGSVLALKGSAYRVTNDIDLAGPEEATQKQFIILMEIAEELGLPVEAINQAGAFFLTKIKDWQKNLVKVHAGKTAVFYRPNLTLFVLLKLRRLSETDLTDCIKLLELEEGSPLDGKRIERDIQSLIQNEKRNSQRAKRAQELLNKIRGRS